MKNPAVLGVVRHLLTIAAGALTSKGVINPDETEILVGATLGILGVIWSIFDKKKTAKQLRATPVE